MFDIENDIARFFSEGYFKFNAIKFAPLLTKFNALSDSKENSEPLINRLQRSFGPLIGAIILDLVDLASFGPLGIGGFFIGGLVGWWMLSTHEISTSTRMWLSLLAGVYCLVPFTELIPVATLIAALARYKQSKKEEG